MALSFKKETLIYFIVFAILVTVSRLPSLNLILDTDSSANAFFARQMMRGEILYDKFHTAHHLPGIYYTFLTAFKLFGDQPMAPRLLLIAFVFPSTWLLFLMGRRFFNDLIGTLGAFFYVLGTSQHYLAGNTAEMEHFANLFIIASVYVFFLLLKKNAHPVHFIWIGVLSAICILYKIIFIGAFAAIGISILLLAWMERDQTGNIKKLILRVAAIGVGLGIPLMLIGLYFASLGLWDRLMLVFQLGFNYVDQSFVFSFPKPFGFPLFMLAMNNIALLFVGLFGAYRLIRRSIPLRTVENLMNFTLLSWLICSLILAGFRGGGYQHYVLVVIPPLVLTAAVEISTLYRNWQGTSSLKNAQIGIGVVIVLIFFNYLWRNYELYRSYLPGLTGDETTYVAIQAQDMQTFDYIKAHTSPEDFIYVWSINIQLYYYADRLPPIDILWPSYVSATGPAERIFNPHTKYIVVDDPEIFTRPDWLINGLEQNYYLETTINDLEIYRRNGS